MKKIEVLQARFKAKSRFKAMSFFKSNGSESRASENIEEAGFMEQLQENMGPVEDLDAGDCGCAVKFAHEYNNVLQIISSIAELMSFDSTLGKTQKEFLAQIKRATKRGAELADQSLVGRRRNESRFAELNLDPLVISQAELLQPLLGVGIEVVVIHDDELWGVNADAGGLEQVLTNLALNARDAMPGGGYLVLETSNVEFGSAFCRSNSWARPGQYVSLSVTDTGKGMAEEIRAQVFDQYFTTKPAGRGTGLGLSILKTIVQQHRGFVNVESKVGVGTRIQVYLPRSGQPNRGSWHHDEDQPTFTR